MLPGADALCRMRWWWYLHPDSSTCRYISTEDFPPNCRPVSMCCETSWWSNDPAVDPSPDTDPDGPETPARSRPTSGSGKSRRSTCGLRTREDRVRTSLPFKIIKRISPVLDSDWLSRVRSCKVTHTFVYICVARQPLWCVAATTVSEELHCLAEEYYHYIYLLCFILWTVL